MTHRSSFGNVQGKNILLGILLLVVIYVIYRQFFSSFGAAEKGRCEGARYRDNNKAWCLSPYGLSKGYKWIPDDSLLKKYKQIPGDSSLTASTTTMQAPIASTTTMQVPIANAMIMEAPPIGITTMQAPIAANATIMEAPPIGITTMQAPVQKDVPTVYSEYAPFKS